MKGLSCWTMEKKMYLIFALLIAGISHSQINIEANSFYKFEIFGYMGDAPHCSGSTIHGLKKITVKFQNGTQSEDLFNGTMNNQDFSYEYSYTKNNPIIHWQVDVLRRHRNGWGDCNQSDWKSHQDNVSSCYSTYISPGSHNLQNLSVRSIPIVEIDYNGEDLILGSEEYFNLNVEDNISSNFYHWKYQVGSGPIKNFLFPYNESNILNFRGGDIFSDSDYGKMISIWNDTQCSTDSQQGRTSTIVTFTYLKSAPKIINHGPSVKTTCFDAKDGQHRLYFDRPLDPNGNEYIGIELRNTVQGSPINFADIYQLEADNSFNMTGLTAGTYEVRINGEFNGVPIFSETTVDPIVITIEKNDPVDFSITKTDVWCYQGTDGQIHLTASGGTSNGYEYQLNGGNWIPFTNPTSFTHTINDLTEGDYTLKVRDANACVAKIQGMVNGEVSLGAEKEISITLTAPQQPLKIEYTLVQEPTFNGATNGKLVAKVEGGTLFADNSYWFEWKNEQGQTQTATTQFTSGAFYITLDQIPSGNYYLTIRDKNYTNATDKTNCIIIESEIELTQPEPLSAVIELIKPISCHVANEFGDQKGDGPDNSIRDEAQDGVLKVIAQGGKIFIGTENGGKPYKYTWKKQNADGSWTVLSETDDTLSWLSDGNYAVNVEDANGIIIGIYQNNALVSPTDVTYYLQQPEKFELTFDSAPATCAGGDGFAKVIATGGTPPYTYSWTNGETTAEISDLYAMTYFVTITDARGCRVEGSVVIDQPDDILITEEITPLLCYNASNASINVTVIGGTLPYTYLWNTGAISSTITELTSGTYSVAITDAQGCVYTKSYTIENPDEIRIDLGEDRTLCNEQTLELDATIQEEPGTQYSWTSDNGFSSNQPKVVLTDPGIYTVTAVTPKGCTITDSVTIARSNFDIDSEFLLTTQAFVNEEVVLVNVSNPKGKTTEWMLPDSDDVSALEESTDYITLNFSKTGTYTVTLMQTQGDCYQLFNKEIIVEENNGTYNPVNTNSGFIKEFTLAPNPTDGNFDVIVKLEDASVVKLRLFSISGKVAHPEKSLPSAKVHHVNYSINVPAGTYVLVLETPYQVVTKKLIIY